MSLRLISGCVLFLLYVALAACLRFDAAMRVISRQAEDISNIFFGRSGYANAGHVPFDWKAAIAYKIFATLSSALDWLGGLPGYLLLAVFAQGLFLFMAIRFGVLTPLAIGFLALILGYGIEKLDIDQSMFADAQKLLYAGLALLSLVFMFAAYQLSVWIKN